MKMTTDNGETVATWLPDRGWISTCTGRLAMLLAGYFHPDLLKAGCEERDRLVAEGFISCAKDNGYNIILTD